LGIVVLTNAGNVTTDFFTQIVVRGIFDRLMGIESEPSIEDEFNANAGYDPDEFHAAMDAARIFEADPTLETQYLGEYSSLAGEVSVADHDGVLTLITGGNLGDFEFELVGFETGHYLVNHSALVGVVMSFEIYENGQVNIAQDGAVFGQKAGDGEIEVNFETFSDPDGRFTIEYPTSLGVQEVEGLVIFNSASPGGVFLVTSGESDGSDLQGDVVSFIQGLDPAFDLEPLAVETLTVNGREWIQFEFDLLIGQVLTVRAFAEDGMGYLILGQGATDDADALEDVLDLLTAGFAVGTE